MKYITNRIISITDPSQPVIPPLPDEPAILLTAVEDIVYIDGIILNLIEHQIPFFYKHFVVLVLWDIGGFKERESLGHFRQGTQGIGNLRTFSPCGIFIYLCHETNMRS